MQVNNISNTNFQGSFLIKKATPEVKKTLPTLVNNGRLVFDRFADKTNDVLMVTKDKHDNIIKEFLEKNNLKFEYIPQFNTYKCKDYMGKESELPALIENLMVENGRRRRVKKVEKLNDLSTAEHAFVANNKLGKNQSLLTRNENGEYTYVIGKPATVKPKSVKEATIKKPVAKEVVAPKVKKKNYETRPVLESEDYVKNIATTYNLDFNRPVKNIRGVRIIEVPEVSSKLMISKPDEKGRHFVMIKTQNSPNNRLVLNSQGKYLYSMNSKEDAALFDKKFQSLLEPKS